MKRRAFLGAALATAAWNVRGAVPERANVDDFETMWQHVDAGYAYFDAASHARWRRAREPGRTLARRATTRAQLAKAIESALLELRDDHVTLADSGAPTRRIPYELDIWPRWRDNAAAIEAVRTFSDADVAGLHAGQVITRVEGVPVENASRHLGRDAASVADIEWALRRVIAGPRSGVQRLEVRDGGRLATVEVERNRPAPSTSPPVLGRRMGDERDIGYIRLRIGANDPDLASHFAGALGHMSGTRALIVDLRENAGPGSRLLTTSVLSHFARPDAAWQLSQARGKPQVKSYVEPAAAIYGAPVAVLVDRWTAGEGEALATGIAALTGGQVVGTPMAGLRGELSDLELRSGLVVRFPGARTFTVDGAPREAFKPHVAVDLSAPSGGPGDPILYQALKLFERR